MSVLQRKAQVGKREHQARSMTVPKALRVALAKVADSRFDMALAVIGVTQEKCASDDVASAFGKDGLLLMLDGPEGKCGAAIMESPMVTALVQQQTMGRVLTTSAPTRPMTATDAALCAPLLDALFERAHDLLEADEDKAVLATFKFGARIEDERLLGLALDASEYNILRLTVDVAGGVAQAMMTFILPVPEAKPDPIDVQEGATDAASTRTLEQTVMGAQAELSAVLCHLHLSLSEISALEPGDFVSIPPEAFDAVELNSIDGRCIGNGAMGQVDGKRAVMLSVGRSAHRDVDDDFEESSDYTNLDLPELKLPASHTLIDPSMLDDLPDLPEIDGLVEIDGEIEDAIPALPELPDIPDFDETPDETHFETATSDFPDLEEEATGLEDLPKLNIA